MGCCDSRIQSSTLREGRNTNLSPRFSKHQFEDEYEIEQSLGSGSFGRVYQVKHKTTGLVRACKQIIIRDNLDAVYEEVKIMHHLDHPNFAHLIDMFITPKQAHIVMELCTGGELFNRIINQKQFSEVTIRNYMLDLFSAMHFLHSQGIVHRDIKPENLLFETERVGAHLKLVDFGTSTFLEPGQTLNLQIGTCYYVAPEVLTGNYDNKCDVWSAGVILYILLTGKPPFNGKDEDEIIYRVINRPLELKPYEWKNKSKDAKDLAQKMLNKDPSRRPSFSDCLKHPWFSVKLDNSIVNTDCLNKLKEFEAQDKLERASFEYMSSHLLSQEELKDINDLFRQMDIDKDGRLSKDELRNGFSKFGIAMDPSEVMEKCDTDASGFIEYREFVVASMDKAKSLNKQKLYETFKMFDKNEDGVITFNEIKEVIGGDDNRISQLLVEADINGDGEIDFEEFSEYLLKKGKQKYH